MCTSLQTSLPEIYARMLIDGNCHGMSELVLGVTNKSLRLTGMVISSQASPHQSTLKLPLIPPGQNHVGHGYFTGFIAHCHQAELWTKLMPFLQQPVSWTASFWTLHHLPRPIGGNLRLVWHQDLEQSTGMVELHMCNIRAWSGVWEHAPGKFYTCNFGME